MSGNPTPTLAPTPKRRLRRGLTPEQIESLGPLTFGFDIGIASVGWAVLSETRIVDLGVRCFDAAEDPKEKVSLNQARRISRVSRNRFAQRRSRLKRLEQLFVSIGLLCRPEVSALFAPTQIPGLKVTDIWEIRSEALRRLLTPEELARVLHSLVKWRGYGSLREATDRAESDRSVDSAGGRTMMSESSKEESEPEGTAGKPEKFGPALDDSTALIERLLSTDKYATVGQLVYAVSSLNFKPQTPDELKAHNRYLSAKRNHADGYARLYPRRLLRGEIVEIFKRQREFQNPFADAVVPDGLPVMSRVHVGADQPRVLSRSFEDQVLALFDEQFPPIVAAHMEQLVGKCPLEEQLGNRENRVPRESFSTEYSRWLQDLNKLEVKTDSDLRPRRLSGPERDAVIALPFEKSEVTYKDLRATLCEKAGWSQDWRLANFPQLTYRSVAKSGSDHIRILRDEERITLSKFVIETFDKKERKAAKAEFDGWLTRQAAAGPISIASLRARLAAPLDCQFEIKKKSSERVLQIAEEAFKLPLTNTREAPLPAGYSIRPCILTGTRPTKLPLAAWDLLKQWAAAGEPRTLKDFRDSVPALAWPAEHWQFFVEQNSPAIVVSAGEEASTFIEQSYTDPADVEGDRFIQLKGWHKLRKALSTDHAALWEELKIAASPVSSETGCRAAKRIDDIFVALTMNFTDGEIRRALEKIEPQLGDAAIDTLLKIVSSGFGHLSFIALRAIRPKLEEGMVYSVACAESEKHYDHSGARSKRTSAKFLAELDTFQFRRISVKTGDVKRRSAGKDAEGKQRFIDVEEKRYKGLANPVVARSFNQARKVLNALIEVYNSPSYIAIELSRDLSKPGEVRKQIDADKKTRAKRKIDDRKMFCETYPQVIDPSHKLMRLVRMREEQGQKCMYSGKPIDMDRLLESLTPGREFKYVEVDHVLPRSRTADNSLDNQVLVLANENQRKGNRTPFEWRGKSDESWWHQFKITVAGLPLMSTKKKARLLLERLDEEEFVGRNLVDTQYATRLFARMIREGLMFKGSVKAEEGNLSTESTSKERWDNMQRARVRTPQGGATAMLRGLWGLTKNREASDLHHAVDACVIAAASPALIHRLTNYYKFRETVLITSQGEAVWRETGELLSHEELETFTEPNFPDPFAPHRFHQEVMARISGDGRTYLTKGGVPKQYDFANYHSWEREAIVQPFVSRGHRSTSGELHEQSVWSIRAAPFGRRQRYVQLVDLTEAQYKNAVGRGDGRNQWFFDEIERRIGAETGGKFEVRAKKAFRNPIIKPCATNKPPHRIRRIKIEEKLEPSVTVRGGAAALGEMCSYRLGLDSSGRFAIEPQYAVKLGRGGAFVGQKTATISDAVVLSTASGRKWINLRKHDYLAIQWDSTATREPRRVEGYLHQYESDGRLTLRRHDQAIIENSGENCHYRSTDWTGAIAIQIFRVSVVGELELIEECTRTSPKALARRKTERASASGSGGDTNTP